jgi:hypothetical protein
MILDERTEFCDAQALNTGAAGSYTLGDQIDMTATSNIGTEDELYLAISVATGITAGSAGTVAFQLVSADDAALTTNPVVHFQTAAFVTGTGTGTTTLRPGTTLAGVKLPQGFDYKRFLGVRQVTGTAAVTAGAIDAFLTPDAALWRATSSPSQA